jgi:acylphosphatase
VTVRRRVLVSGSVQGVGFRQSLAVRARAREVCGSVRNLPDGRVEAVLEGDETAVAALVAWCRTGPRGARVDSVGVRSEPVAGDSWFDVR